MRKIKICWITTGYLLQVDLPILSYLKEFFEIHWVVLAAPGSDMEKNAKEYAVQHGIDIEIRTARGHRYLPFCLLDYYPLCRDLAKIDADIYYCNWTPFPYAWIPFEKYIPADRLLMAMHHGSLHDGMQLKHLYKYYLKHVIRRKIKYNIYNNYRHSFFGFFCLYFNFCNFPCYHFSNNIKIFHINIISF